LQLDVHVLDGFSDLEDQAVLLSGQLFQDLLI
jgi:hypothetical protein